MLKRYTLLFLFLTGAIQAQYTDQINSNRPGISIGAFAVGKGIIQFEGGFEYRRHKRKPTITLPLMDPLFSSLLVGDFI